MTKLASNLPSPDTYEQEYTYWPWGRLLEWVAAWVERNAPKNGVIVDYMCGTGFLLNDILSCRPDLSVCGCSITKEYVEWAQQHYSNLHVVLEDALLFRPPSRVDIVLCTAGLHHLPFEKQEVFLSKVASELQPDGRFVVGEELIGVDDLGSRRQQAVLELWFALMQHIVQAGAPGGVVEAAVGVMRADLFADGEYKRSQSAINAMLRERFALVEFKKMWPASPADYGDGVWVCAAKLPSKGESS